MLREDDDYGGGGGIGENSNDIIYNDDDDDKYINIRDALMDDYEAESTARALGIPSPRPTIKVIQALSNSDNRFIIIHLNHRTEAPVLYSSVRPKEPVKSILIKPPPPPPSSPPQQQEGDSQPVAAAAACCTGNTTNVDIPWILAPINGSSSSGYRIPQSTISIDDGRVKGVEPKTAQMLAIDNTSSNGFVHFMPIVDYEAHRIHPSAIKADKLSRKYTSKLPHLPTTTGTSIAAAIAGAPRPSAEENRALTRLIRLPFISQPLTLPQKHLLLRYCWGLSKQPEALQRVMQAVDWNDPDEVEEAQTLLDIWAPLGFDDALCLLTPTPTPVETPGAVSILRPPPPPVWYYAVSRLQDTSTDDNTLSLYLLQLTLALRYEKPSMAPSTTILPTQQQDQQGVTTTRGFGRRPLAQFLVRRATKSLPIATALFWMLQAEKRTPTSSSTAAAAVAGSNTTTASASAAAPPVIQSSITPLIGGGGGANRLASSSTATFTDDTSNNGSVNEANNGLNTTLDGNNNTESLPSTTRVLDDDSIVLQGGGEGTGDEDDDGNSLPPGDASIGDVSEPDIDAHLAGFVRAEVSTTTTTSSSTTANNNTAQNIDIFSLTAQHLWRELGRSEASNPEGGPKIRKALEAQCALRQRLLEVAKAVKHVGSADLTRPIPFNIAPPLPIDPSVRLVRVDANRSFCIKSSMMPIVLTCEVVQSTVNTQPATQPATAPLMRHQGWQKQQQQQQPGKDIRQYMFKVGDDLRQDQLVLQLITVMDSLFKKYGLDLRLTPYKVVALSPRDGMIEFVSRSRTLSSALRENGNNLMTYFKNCAKASSSGGGGGQQQQQHASSSESSSSSATRLKEILETFTRSCAGYCVITYVLGIGDRHLDNLMVDDEGHMFHVDFGYIFGRDPKPLPPPMKLCKEMVEGMGGQDSQYFRLFRQYCYSAYRILRTNSKLILSLVGLVQGANIKDLVEQDPQMVLSRMEQKLAPEISEEEAESRFLGLINDSTNALFPLYFFYMDVDNLLSVPKICTWCKGVVGKLSRATSNPLMRTYLGYVLQRLDAGEYTSTSQYWDEVYRSINAVEDPVNQGRLNPTMEEDKVAFRGFETVYSLAALDPEDRATYFESWFTEDVDHSRAGATEVKTALAECDIFFKDMSDDDVDKCIDIVRQNASKFPVDSRHFLESFPAPGTMHHKRRKAADKESKDGLGDGVLSEEEIVERRVKSAISKRLTAEELRTDIERTMDTGLRPCYGPLYTTSTGALARDVYREPIEIDDNDKTTTSSTSGSNVNRCKSTAELRAEAMATYKEREDAYYKACPLSLDIHLCSCIPIQPKVLWSILKDDVMWCSPYSGMELALRKTKALKVVEDDSNNEDGAASGGGGGKKSQYIPRDLMKQIEQLIRELGSNATVDKLMRRLDWGKNSQKKERFGPLREVLGRLPRVFYEPDYMFLREGLEGIVSWPDDDDERSEEDKLNEMVNTFDYWCRLSINKAEVSNNLVTMLSTPESCPERRYPLNTAKEYLATNGVNPDHELALLTDLFIPGNNIYLRKGYEDKSMEEEDGNNKRVSEYIYNTLIKSPYRAIDADALRKVIRDNFTKEENKAFENAINDVIKAGMILPHKTDTSSSSPQVPPNGDVPASSGEDGGIPSQSTSLTHSDDNNGYDDTLYQHFFHDPLNIYLATDAEEYLSVKDDIHVWNRLNCGWLSLPPSFSFSFISQYYSSMNIGQLNDLFSIKVDGIDDRVRKDDLREGFAKFGEIGDVFIPVDRYTGVSRGFGFVRFYERRDAEDAIRDMDNTDFQGCRITVAAAMYNKESSYGGGKGKGYGRGGYGGGGYGSSGRYGGGGGYDDRYSSPPYGGYPNDARRGSSRERRSSRDRSRSPYERTRGTRDETANSRSRSRDNNKSPSRRRRDSRSRSSSSRGGANDDAAADRR
ncbi:Serine arginine-rich splicing factor 2 [Perkinsus chesapeaki]|uniref:Serine arginine-rich splicing factor 2 n=1 Tax=Perkinsus chesapeaki TaxID=330153 RepID=A0A7J6MAQ0_PERCH|nr:Serine arginine-rich splicing factor 2 [Perkinsus chesapeaki]